MANKINIVIDQGTSFSQSFNIKDEDGVAIDMTVFTSLAMMRKHYTSTNATSFSVGLSSNGDVTLSLTSNVTANLVPGRYLYDVEVIDSSNATFRVVEGIVTVTPNMTR